MRRLVILATVVALLGSLPTSLEPAPAADPGGRQAADVGPAPPTSDDHSSTSADPPAPAGRAWRAVLVDAAPVGGGALRAAAAIHPAGPRRVSSGSSRAPNPRSRQHISPLTVSLRI